MTEILKRFYLLCQLNHNLDVINGIPHLSHLMQPLPFFSIWAGYRLHMLNYAVGPVDFETETSGFYAGVGLHF
jgi:hypothetical protein